MEIYVLTMKVKGKEEERVYSIIAPSEKYLHETIINGMPNQELIKVEKQECFVLRIK